MDCPFFFESTPCSCLTLQIIKEFQHGLAILGVPCKRVTNCLIQFFHIELFILMHKNIPKSGRVGNTSRKLIRNYFYISKCKKGRAIGEG